MQVMVRCNWFNSWHTGMCVTQLPGSKALGRPAGRRQLLFAPRRARHPRGYVGPFPSEKTNLSAGRAAYRGPERRGGGFGRLANGIRRPVYVFDAN